MPLNQDQNTFSLGYGGKHTTWLEADRVKIDRANTNNQLSIEAKQTKAIRLKKTNDRQDTSLIRKEKQQKYTEEVS